MYLKKIRTKGHFYKNFKLQGKLMQLSLFVVISISKPSEEEEL